MSRILCIVGARPQFIKAAPFIRAVQKGGGTPLLLHTGQHYDAGMSDVFFTELELPPPARHLGIGSGTPGAQIGPMLVGVESYLLESKPDCVVVFGDTNSTLAGALATRHCGLPLAHIEAGLRSFNRAMPEETNRIVTDHISDRLFCPTELAVENLRREGITQGVHAVGDVMVDALLQNARLAEAKSNALARFEVEPGKYLLATIHRGYNTDFPEQLDAILDAFEQTGETVLFPIHPRTRARLGGRQLKSNVRILDPLPYLDMLQLERNARRIVTDSGGIQKEAFLFGVPCVTVRTETEWKETLETGWNRLTGASPEKILAAVRDESWPTGTPPSVYGDGNSCERIYSLLK